jgi:hypothetical protein
MSLKNRYKKTLGIEKLDDRSMLAGNVVAAVSEGALQITGDSKDNVITVRQTGESTWTVTGLPAITSLKTPTKINGLTSPQVFEGVESIDIVTGNGNDGVAVLNGFLPGELSVDTGANKDFVALTNLQLGSVNVSTGGDTDGLLVVNVTVNSEGPTEGPNFAPLGGSLETGEAFFDTGDATDFVLLANVRAPNLTLNTGKGNDFVGLLGVHVDNALCVDVGAGTDMLAVVQSTSSTARFKNGNSKGEMLFTAANSFGSLSSDFNKTIKLDALLSAVSNSLKTLPASIGAITGNSALSGLGLSSLINKIV